jgi:hypothetical protein
MSGVMKQTNTRIGRKFELYAEKHLPGFKLKTNENRLYSFDGLFEGQRINVKAAQLRFSKYNRGWYWKFNLHNHYENCDWFLLYGYIKKLDKQPARAWLIPSCLLQKRYVSFSKNYKGPLNKYEIDVLIRKEVNHEYQDRMVR